MRKLAQTLSLLFVAAIALVTFTACFGEEGVKERIEIDQRSSTNIIDHDVWLEIGDIQFGHRVKDVLIEADSRIIARDGSMGVGDTLDFTYQNVSYILRVEHLQDEHFGPNDLSPTDSAVFSLRMQ